MTINNPALYDAAYCAIANSNAIWSNDAVPTDYASMRDAATNNASEIDALIPTIAPRPTLSEILLMESIVKSTFNDRYALDKSSAFYAAIAAVIVAQWIEFGSGLQDSAVATPSAFVYFLDSDADGVIANYYQLTPASLYVPSNTASAATAAGTPNSTVQFAVGGNPVAWIVATAIGGPYVQQGQWVDDLYAAVSQAVSTTNIKLSFYSRTTGGVETHLFDIMSPRVISPTAAVASSEAPETTYPIAPTDRLVVKAFAVFSGAAVAGTATLYFDGLTNASHIHTPIERNQQPT